MNKKALINDIYFLSLHIVANGGSREGRDRQNLDPYYNQKVLGLCLHITTFNMFGHGARP